MLFIRGPFHAIQMWLTQAQGQYFQWLRKNLNICECGQNKKGHKKKKCSLKKFTRRGEIKLLQLGVRPSIFGSYELIFPEESLSELLSMLGVGQPHMWPLLVGIKGLVLRKVFGCKKIPQKNLDEALKIPNTISLNGSTRGLNNIIVPGVAHHIIGIKKDLRHDCPTWGYNQEMV